MSANLPEESDPLEMPPELGLPIEHLFQVDPLDLTQEDLLLLSQHYRNQRMNFQKKEMEKPKTVTNYRTTGPKLDAEASQAKIDEILAMMVGGGLKEEP